MTSTWRFFRFTLCLPLIWLILAPMATAAPLASLSICKIQGDEGASKHVDDFVTTSGVVSADLDDTAARGFYLQHAGCDAKPSTSDGIFVEISERVDIVDPGDQVEVSGTIQETGSRTQLYVRTSRVTILSHGNPLPAAIDLAPPFDPLAARLYYEQLEGMLVRLDAARVIGPTGEDGRTWLLRRDLGLERLFHDHPGGAGAAVCAADDGRFKVTPPSIVGDLVDGLVGALDESREDYCLRLINPLLLSPSGLAPGSAGDSLPGLTVATFNLANLFDTQDDPAKDDSVLSTAEYQRRLYKRARAIRDSLQEPAILAVQEAENLSVLQAMVYDTDILRSDYQILWVDGPDRRGLDQALLVRTDRVIPFGTYVFQSCTSLVDGLGPDGNQDPTNPINLATCDTDGDGVMDGNRLFSRPPLVVELGILPSVGQPVPGGQRGRVLVIAAHLKSKAEDSANHAFTEPRRIQQAHFLAVLAQNLRTVHPEAGLLVVGDLNDVTGSTALQPLLDAGFVDISHSISPAFRYTYIFKGVSQAIDHILWMPSISLAPQAAAVAHINADFPAIHTADIQTVVRSSDHDPLWARFGVASRWLWLPLAYR